MQPIEIVELIFTVFMVVWNLYLLLTVSRRDEEIDEMFMRLYEMEERISQTEQQTNRIVGAAAVYELYSKSNGKVSSHES